MQALQRPPTNAEVANALGVAESDVALIEQARTQRDLSLSVDDREGTIDLHDREGRSPEELVSGCEERVETARLVQRAVSQLRPRDRSIIQQHLLAEEPREMAEIARSLGTSRQRVSQILMRVRRQLASELRNVAS